MSLLVVVVRVNVVALVTVQCLVYNKWNNSKRLAQVVRALVFVVVSWSLKFEFTWVQTILWGQSTGKTRVFLDPCGEGALHGSEVYLTRVGTRSGSALEGFLVIKKEKESRIVECSWNSVKKLILCVLRFDSHPKKSLSVIRLCVLFVLLFTKDMRLTQLILQNL
jgi:hypothetical protein